MRDLISVVIVAILVAVAVLMICVDHYNKQFKNIDSARCNNEIVEILVKHKDKTTTWVPTELNCEQWGESCLTK